MSAGGEEGDEVEEVEEEVFKVSPLSSPLSLSTFFFFFCCCSSYSCLSSACERRDLAAMALPHQYLYFGTSKARSFVPAIPEPRALLCCPVSTS